MSAPPGAADGTAPHLRPYLVLDDYTEPGEQVPFSALVRARWWLQQARERREHLGSADVPELESRYQVIRRRYEEQNAPILAEYYCTRVVGACVLTGPPSPTGARLPRRLSCALNLADDRLLAMEQRVEELEREAQSVFADRDDEAARAQLSWATKACYDAMTHVLAAADDLAAGPISGVDEVHRVEAAHRQVQELTRQVRSVVQRQARFTYFVGVLVGAVLTLVGLSVAGVLVDVLDTDGGLDVPPLIGAAIGGTVGAVVSVFQRLSTGNLVLDFTAPLRQRLLLGGLRPLAGAVFGVVASLALAAGLTGTSGAAPRDVAFSLVVGFLAGFSERLAIDILERAGRTVTGTAPVDAPVPLPRGRSQVDLPPGAPVPGVPAGGAATGAPSPDGAGRDGEPVGRADGRMTTRGTGR